MLYAARIPAVDFSEIQTANVPVLGANAFALGRAPDPIPVRQVGWGTTGGSAITRGW